MKKSIKTKFIVFTALVIFLAILIISIFNIRVQINQIVKNQKDLGLVAVRNTAMACVTYIEGFNFGDIGPLFKKVIDGHEDFIYAYLEDNELKQYVIFKNNILVPTSGKSKNIEALKSLEIKNSGIHDFDSHFDAVAIIEINKEIWGRVRIGISKDRISKTISNAIINFFIMILVFSILGVVGAYYIGVIITNPIKKLVNRVEYIGKGHFDEKVNVKSKDEVSVLANSINDMSDKIIELLKETAEKARMDQELRTAQLVQKSLFPDQDPDLEGLDVSGYFISASETGGDWYGYITIDKSYHYIMIGDVTGHGTATALVTAQVHSACSMIKKFKDEYAETKISPKIILDQLNDIVLKAGREQYAMTFFVARFNINTKELVYSNGGHNFPLYYSAETKKLCALVCSGPRLGYRIESTYVESSCILKSGDAILFYTDGLVECRNSKNVYYGKKRMRDLFVKNLDRPASKIRESLIKDFMSFFEEQPREDDITFVVVKVL